MGVFSTLFGLIGGLTLGTMAGAIGGWVDALVMRTVDVMLSIPSLLLAFTIASLARQPSQWTIITAIAIIQVPIFARLLRGSMLAQRGSDHVLAARSLGVRPRAIVFRHMLPNSLSPVIVQATLVLAMMLQRFDFDFDGPYTYDFKETLTIKPADLKKLDQKRKILGPVAFLTPTQLQLGPKFFNPGARVLLYDPATLKPRKAARR